MLELGQCEAYYGSSRIIQGIDLEVARGEAHGLIGRNGVGKSTLMRAILGLPDRVSGTLRVDGQDLTNAPPNVRAKAGVGFVPQNRDILRGFTVEENLLIGAYARTDRIAAVPESIWEMFPALKEHRYREGSNLSGGQQQQLAIARALIGEPKVLLLDEPTEGIQPNVVAEIGEIVRRLNAELGLSIILVEQQIHYVRQLCSKFSIIEKGQIVESGEIADLTDDVVKRRLSV